MQNGYSVEVSRLCLLNLNFQYTYTKLCTVIWNANVINITFIQSAFVWASNWNLNVAGFAAPPMSILFRKKSTIPLFSKENTSQMANSLWSEENSPQLYLFFAHLWQLNFLVKLITLTQWRRITDTICKQKIVVLWNVAFSANVGELAFCCSFAQVTPDLLKPTDKLTAFFSMMNLETLLCFFKNNFMKIPTFVSNDIHWFPICSQAVVTLDESAVRECLLTVDTNDCENNSLFVLVDRIWNLAQYGMHGW